MITNKSGKYYEETGDNLTAQGRIEEARRAYLHAMGDYTQPMDLEAYKRALKKLIKIDSSEIDLDGSREVHRRMGQVRSQAKAEAARENGEKGGRPRKMMKN